VSKLCKLHIHLILSYFIKIFKKNYHESGYLFIQDNGLQMHPTTVSKWFPNYSERNGLPRVTLYGLRHASATLLLESGMDLKAIAKRLGHSDARMLLKVYGHVTTRADQAAAATMDDLFKIE
jgi:integrase